MRSVMTIVLLLASVACQEENAAPNTPIDDDFDPTQATLLRSGSLMGAGGHTASGTASVYDQSGKLVVLLSPYSSQNGPDLKVYLSKDEAASSYINLGALKSTMGKQSYEVPGNPNLADYDFVLIWCERFTVIFGKAELQ